MKRAMDDATQASEVVLDPVSVVTKKEDDEKAPLAVDEIAA